MALVDGRVEAVDKSLARHLLQDSLIVVVAERARELVVVHIVAALAASPEPGQFLSLEHFELASCVRPFYHASESVGPAEELQQKLPELQSKLSAAR